VTSKTDGEAPGSGPDLTGRTAPSDGAGAEVRFFNRRSEDAEPEPSSPPRRDSPLLARAPVFAVVMLGLCGWLLSSLWPDAAYFFAPAEPIDLGGPAVFHLERAVPNRLCRVRGGPLASVAGVEVRSAESRRIIGLFGASLIVDRPGGAGPAAVYEGRLLPESKTGEYQPFLGPLRERGFTASGKVWVLRDGARPRTAWKPVALALVLLALAAVNLRALAKRLLA
jgi:hypothetical protein